MIRSDPSSVVLLLLAMLAVADLSAAAEEVLVSRPLAEARGLEVGDTLRLARSATAEDGGRAFRVVGIYEPVPDPMRISQKRYEVRLHLPDLVDLTEAGAVDPAAREAAHAVNIALRDPERLEEVQGMLAARLPGLAVVRTRGEGGVFEVLDRFHFAIAVVTLLGASAFLLALVVMRAGERREIAGILRLVGFPKVRILQQVLLEGLLIAVLGAVLGVGLAWGVQDAANLFFQHRYDTALVFVRVTPAIAARCVVLAVPLGVLAGLVASWALLRREAGELLGR